MPNRRPRTSCVHPPFRSPPLAWSRRDVRRSLYWRSKTQTPHGGIHRGRPSGHRSPPGTRTQGVLGRSRQVGSVPEVTAIERTQRGSKHFASLRSASCSKPRATRQEPLKKVQGVGRRSGRSSTRCNAMPASLPQPASPTARKMGREVFHSRRSAGARCATSRARGRGSAAQTSSSSNNLFLLGKCPSLNSAMGWKADIRSSRLNDADTSKANFRSRYDGAARMPPNPASAREAEWQRMCKGFDRGPGSHGVPSGDLSYAVVASESPLRSSAPEPEDNSSIWSIWSTSSSRRRPPAAAAV